jgi:hypothetical protein
VQLAEAFGPVNRWYCAQAHGRPVDDPETLLVHFIRAGGAADFAARYDEAMGPLNRWYCSEFYGREVRDPETLWDYYMQSRQPGGRLHRAGRPLDPCHAVLSCAGSATGAVRASLSQDFIVDPAHATRVIFRPSRRLAVRVSFSGSC